MQVDAFGDYDGIFLDFESYGQEYGEQKELLDKIHEKTGEDNFVASYSAFFPP